MKMLVAGVFRMKGVGKTGNPYDFSRLVGLVAIETVNNEKMQKTGFGLEPSDINVDPDCLEQFKKYHGQFPLMLELETDVIPRMGSFETVVSGIKGVVHAVKAA